MRIALLYEHPTWSNELIARAAERNLDVHTFCIADGDVEAAAAGAGGEFDLWINRINAMPSQGRPPSLVAATGHLLLSLELRGQRVINGSTSHRIGGSKAAQNALFATLGLAAPASIGIYDPSHALAAARSLGFPVLTKPNIGGSGSGITRFDSADEMQAAIDAGTIDLGIDGTGLVQRVISSADGLVHRVEMLGAELFYGTDQALQPMTYNYCAADGCAVAPDDIVVTHPSAEIIAQAALVMTASATDVGGVEYLIDAATGQPAFYDFNPYSNFISGYDDELGFNPIDRYLDSILARFAAQN